MLTGLVSKTLEEAMLDTEYKKCVPYLPTETFHKAHVFFWSELSNTQSSLELTFLLLSGWNSSKTTMQVSISCHHFVRQCIIQMVIASWGDFENI